MFARRTRWELTPNRFSAALERARASGKQLLDLTESNPTRVGLRYPDGWLQALADPAGLQYQPDARGTPGAREAVAGYYRELGVEVPTDAIFLTTSTSEAYSFLFRLLCDPDDQVLTGAPSYPLFDFLASIQDVELVSYPLLYDHGWQIDLHSVGQRMGPRTRAVLLVNPDNPTGSYVKAGERDRLNEMCAPHGLAVIADEVFLDYGVDGRPPVTFAGNQDALTFTLSGLSKVAALPQVKLSWMVVSGPKAARDEALRRLEVIADAYLSVSTAVQLATPKLLAERSQVQEQIKGRVRENLAELDRQVGSRKECSRLQVEGGWYAVLRVPVTGSDEELAVRLLETAGLIVHPGHFYDFPSEGYLVLSLISRPQVMREGLQRLLTSL